MSPFVLIILSILTTFTCGAPVAKTGSDDVVETALTIILMSASYKRYVFVAARSESVRFRAGAKKCNDKSLYEIQAHVYGDETVHTIRNKKTGLYFSAQSATSLLPTAKPTLNIQEDSSAFFKLNKLEPTGSIQIESAKYRGYFIVVQQEDSARKALTLAEYSVQHQHLYATTLFLYSDSKKGCDGAREMFRRHANQAAITTSNPSTSDSRTIPESDVNELNRWLSVANNNVPVEDDHIVTDHGVRSTRSSQTDSTTASASISTQPITSETRHMVTATPSALDVVKWRNLLREALGL